MPIDASSDSAPNFEEAHRPVGEEMVKRRKLWLTIPSTTWNPGDILSAMAQTNLLDASLNTTEPFSPPFPNLFDINVFEESDSSIKNDDAHQL